MPWSPQRQGWQEVAHAEHNWICTWNCESGQWRTFKTFTNVQWSACNRLTISETNDRWIKGEKRFWRDREQDEAHYSATEASVLIIVSSQSNGGVDNHTNVKITRSCEILNGRGRELRHQLGAEKPSLLSFMHGACIHPHFAANWRSSFATSPSPRYDEVSIQPR